MWRLTSISMTVAAGPQAQQAVRLRLPQQSQRLPVRPIQDREPRRGEQCRAAEPGERTEQGSIRRGRRRDRRARPLFARLPLEMPGLCPRRRAISRQGTQHFGRVAAGIAAFEECRQFGCTHRRANRRRQDDLGAVAQQRLARQRRKDRQHRPPFAGAPPQGDHRSQDRWWRAKPIKSSQMAQAQTATRAGPFLQNILIDDQRAHFVRARIGGCRQHLAEFGQHKRPREMRAAWGQSESDRLQPRGGSVSRKPALGVGEKRDGDFDRCREPRSADPGSGGRSAHADRDPAALVIRGKTHPLLLRSHRSKHPPEPPRRHPTWGAVRAVAACCLYARFRRGAYNSDAIFRSRPPSS